MAIVQRKTIDEVIAERDGDVGVNVGDMSETCRKQMSETSRTIERDLAVMQKAGVIRHEGKDNAGVWVILEQGNTNF